jgi:hypothetical protein
MNPNTNASLRAASAAINQNGTVLLAARVFACSAQAVVTGTSTGTLNIQASNDVNPVKDAKWKSCSGQLE